MKSCVRLDIRFSSSTFPQDCGLARTWRRWEKVALAFQAPLMLAAIIRTGRRFPQNTTYISVIVVQFDVYENDPVKSLHVVLYKTSLATVIIITIYKKCD